jgi:elongation factor Ts
VEITAAMVKDLRQTTGAGVMDCRKALESTEGNFEQAAELLREKALATAAKKAERAVHEGLIGNYVHMGSKVAALVEINCETDFVARTDEFQSLAKDLAMQVVATRPSWVKIEDIPAEIVQQERENYRLGLADANKPAALIDQIIEGKLAKFYEENCLVEQPFIKDEGVKIKDLLTSLITKLGENIVVRRFARLEVGG